MKAKKDKGRVRRRLKDRKETVPKHGTLPESNMAANINTGKQNLQIPNVSMMVT